MGDLQPRYFILRVEASERILRSASRPTSSEPVSGRCSSESCETDLLRHRPWRRSPCRAGGRGRERSPMSCGLLPRPEVR